MPDPSRQDRNRSAERALALCEQSRQPGLAGLDDAALMTLIGKLTAERDKLPASGGDDTERGGKSIAEQLRMALNRAHAERRKRKLRVDGSPQPAPQMDGRAAAPVPKRPPASRRKAAGRKTADSRKTDLRTAAHRIKPARRAAKAPDIPAAPHRMDPTTDQAAPRAEEMAENQVRKADRKAAKQAEKLAGETGGGAEKAKKKDKKDKKDKKKSGGSKKDRKT